MKLSVTDLCAHLFCKRKLYLEKIHKIREEIPKEVLVIGKIKHDTYDFLNKREKYLVINTNNENINEFEQKYKQALSQSITNAIKANAEQIKLLNLESIYIYKNLYDAFESQALNRATQIVEFSKQHNLIANELWQKLEPKIVTEHYVESEVLELKGKIDKIEIYKDKIIPVEIKTGSAPKDGVWDSHQIQIAAYILLLQEKTDKNIRQGLVDYVSQNQKRIVVLNPFLKDDVIKLKEAVKATLASNTVPDFVENKNKCKSCGIREKCYSFTTS